MGVPPLPSIRGSLRAPQVRGFSPAAVWFDPEARNFHDALAVGPDRLTALVAGARPWWVPVADGPAAAGWRELFASSPIFQAWVARHGPHAAAAHGPGRAAGT
jgi:hypothetical protein